MGRKLFALRTLVAAVAVAAIVAPAGHTASGIGNPNTSAVSAANGFDWLDAGIGAGVGIAMLLLALTGVGVVRSRRLAHS